MNAYSTQTSWRWVGAILVSFGIAPLATSQVIDPVNPPPPPLVTTTAWFDWYNGLLQARIDAVTFPRDETRYVSSATGDDDNDGLTPATAWSSVEIAADWIDSSNSEELSREVLFRRGDSWRVSEGITTTEDKVRIADYGDPSAAAPYFSGFTFVISPNSLGWTQVGATPVYWWSESEAVSWVREDGDVDLDFPLSRQASVTGVQQTVGSWWWSKGEDALYIHPRDNDDPRTNGKLYEAAFTTGRGFSVAGDLSLVENMRADGFGLDPDRSTTQHEAFQTRTTATEQAVIQNCTSYYGASHIIAHNSSTTGFGGIATFIDCTAGFTKINSSGETVFNTFAGAGSIQTIFHNCTVARGTLPSVEFTGKRADPVFGHTAPSSGSQMGLTIVYGLHILNHPNGATRTGRFNNTVPANLLQDVRTFFVGSVHEGGDNTGDHLSQLFNENTAYVNCSYTLKPADMGGDGRLQTRQVNGWWINSTLDLDLSNQTGSTFGLYRRNDINNNPRIWNSAILVRNVPSGMEMRIDYSGASSSPNGTMFNTIIEKIGATGSFALTLPNTSANIQNNAYWQVTKPSADSPGFTLSIVEDPIDILIAPSILVSAGASLPGSTPLEYDLLQRPRSSGSLSVGPFEVASLGFADINGDGVVDSVDLMTLLGQWGTAGSADLNSDGVVDAADLATLLGNWG